MVNPPLDFRAWAELSASLQGQDELEQARLFARAQVSEARFALVDAHWRATLAQEERAGHSERATWYRNVCAAVAASLRRAAPAAPSPPPARQRGSLQQTVDIEAAMRDAAPTAALPFHPAASNEPQGRPRSGPQDASPRSPAPLPRPLAASKPGLDGTVDLEAALAKMDPLAEPLPFAARAANPAPHAPRVPVSAPALAPVAVSRPAATPAATPAGEAPERALSPVDSVEAYASFVGAMLGAPMDIERAAKASGLWTCADVHRLHADWARRMRAEPALLQRYRDLLRRHRP